MNKIFTGLLFASLAFYVGKVNAQDTPKSCGINHQLEEMYKNDPSLKKHMEKREQETKHRLMQKTTDDTTVYIIPVVFHILHQNGSENISDAQVIDAMNILNRDFRLQNADTTDIISRYDTLKADIKIEFKLASKDPWGNCTNGIEHIYTHETNFADNNSKLNQWDRTRYLNVWVVNTIGTDGSVAGYSQYPSSVETSNFYADGVIILDGHVGSIGTGSVYNSRALTHEVGHWLNLKHPWGDTNDPGVACGDDEVSDTPVTKGSNLNCNLSLSTCSTVGSPVVIENVQNYMDYSYCSNMFTEGQAARMREALTAIISGRNKLITDSVHALTGIDLVSAPLCSPVAAFYASTKMACQGSSVNFYDKSWQAAVTSRTWTFEDATPATSSSATPSVVFNSPGYKTVTLVVSNATGSDTLVLKDYIYVSPSWPDFTGPYSDNFDTQSTYFLVENDENNYAKFSKNAGVGVDGTNGYFLNVFKNTSGALAYTDDYFYNGRLGGSVDALISNSYDLRKTSGISVSFKYAYATNATTSTDLTEKIIIYSSKDCGANWTPRKTISGSELLTAGYAGNVNFVPSASQWKTYSFTYVSSNTDSQTRFKIEFTASDKSNNLYIDNFNITGTLGMNDEELGFDDLQVYPNPTQKDNGINVSYAAKNAPVKFVLRDLQGKVIFEEVINETSGLVNKKIGSNVSLNSSVYLLEIYSGDYKTTKKVIVTE